VVAGPNNTSGRSQMGMTYVFPTFQFTQLSSLYLGGVPAAVSYIFGRGDNFTGCLGHISWNDIPLQLMDATSGVSGINSTSRLTPLVGLTLQVG